MRPFYKLIKDLTGHDVIPTSRATIGITELLAILERVANKAAQEILDNPIVRPRSNEVGNDIEDYVRDVLRGELAIKNVEIGEDAGYPDIKSQITATREVVFIECKTFNPNTRRNTQRSFYLSDGPAVRKKVDCDAIHIAMSYEMDQSGNTYRPHSYKIIDLYDLPCKLKKEWYSDNQSLYRVPRVLASRECSLANHYE